MVRLVTRRAAQQDVVRVSRAREDTPTSTVAEAAACTQQTFPFRGSLGQFNESVLAWAKGFDPQYVEIVYALGTFANLRTGAVFPSQRKILEKIRKNPYAGRAPSMSTLQRRLRELRRHGVLVAEQRRGHRNRYGSTVQTWGVNEYQIDFTRVVRDGSPQPYHFGGSDRSDEVTDGVTDGAMGEVTPITTVPTTESTTGCTTEPPPGGDGEEPFDDIADPLRVSAWVWMAQRLIEEQAAQFGEQPRTLSMLQRGILGSALKAWRRDGLPADVVGEMVRAFFGSWAFSQHPDVGDPVKRFISIRGHLLEKVQRRQAVTDWTGSTATRAAAPAATRSPIVCWDSGEYGDLSPAEAIAKEIVERERIKYGLAGLGERPLRDWIRLRASRSPAGDWAAIADTLRAVHASARRPLDMDDVRAATDRVRCDPSMWEDLEDTEEPLE